jgi:hypothetical protein
MPETGHGGPEDCEKLRLPHFLDSQLPDGSEIVGLKCWSSFTLRKIPGTHSCYTLSQLQDHSAAGRIRSTDKSNDFNGN